MGKKKKQTISTTLRYILILLFCIPMIFPLLWMFTTALKDNAAVFKVPPQIIPKEFHWENFTKGVAKLNFGRQFMISMGGISHFMYRTGMQLYECGICPCQVKIQRKEVMVLSDYRLYDDSRHGYCNSGFPLLDKDWSVWNFMADDYTGIFRGSFPDFSCQTVYDYDPESI